MPYTCLVKWCSQSNTNLCFPWFKIGKCSVEMQNLILTADENILKCRSLIFTWIHKSKFIQSIDFLMNVTPPSSSFEQMWDGSYMMEHLCKGDKLWLKVETIHDWIIYWSEDLRHNRNMIRFVFINQININYWEMPSMTDLFIDLVYCSFHRPAWWPADVLEMLGDKDGPMGVPAVFLVSCESCMLWCFNEKLWCL